MFVPAPNDKNFVPYTKRPVLPHNAALFIDAGGGGARVVLQSMECAGKPAGTRCGTLRCPDGRPMLACNGNGGCTEFAGC
jgi:hypothetical protein